MIKKILRTTVLCAVALFSITPSVFAQSIDPVARGLAISAGGIISNNSQSEKQITVANSGNNVLAVRNPTGCSAIAFRDLTNTEHGAVGYGNQPGCASTFYGNNYYETSDLGGVNSPPPFKFVSTGVIGGTFGLYTKFQIDGGSSYMSRFLELSSFNSALVIDYHNGKVAFNMAPVSNSLTNTISVSNGSPVITVVDAINMQASPGEAVVISGATSIGGLPINGQYNVQTVSGTTFTVAAGTNATSTVSNGGGTFSVKYTKSGEPVEQIDLYGQFIGGANTGVSRTTDAGAAIITIDDPTNAQFRIIKTNVGKIDLQVNGTYGAHTLDMIDTDNSSVVPLSILLNGSGAVKLGGPEIAGGSGPTLTGTCTTNTQVGGQAAGTFKATCTAQTVIMTFSATAPNGYVCLATDETTVADTLKQTGSSTTSCTLIGTTAAADVIGFMATAY